MFLQRREIMIHVYSFKTCKCVTQAHNCTISKNVASFPGLSHCQYFIASSVKYGRGRPGRCSHVQCHQVDTCAKNLDVLSCTVRPKAGCQSVCKQTIYNVHCSPPRMCLPSVYLTSSHVTRSPGPPYFILEVMKYWRWERPGTRLAKTEVLVTQKKLLLNTTYMIYILHKVTIGITESVDSVCRDTTYTQYMLIQKNLSKSQKRYTYKPL